MNSMLKYASLLGVLLGLAPVSMADDLNPPPWRGLLGSTFQHWGFNQPTTGGPQLPDSGFFQNPTLSQPPLFFPGNMQAVKAFEQFRETGIHHALVLDEYGGVEGFVTLYDVLESIVGDIPLDEHDKDQDVVLRSDGTWLVDGLIPIDELKEIMDVDELPEEDKAGFQTLSGFVMNQLGSIPKTGAVFDWDHWRFEVVDMDGHRVDRVLVTDLSTNDQAQPEG